MWDEVHETLGGLQYNNPMEEWWHDPGRATTLARTEWWLTGSLVRGSHDAVDAAATVVASLFTENSALREHGSYSWSRSVAHETRTQRPLV